MVEQGALAIASPVSRQLYTDLLAAIKPIGPFREEIKKTSIHLVRGSAFAGVHPRQQYLILTVKAGSRFAAPGSPRWNRRLRIAGISTEKALQARIPILSLGWLRQAYGLCM